MLTKAQIPQIVSDLLDGRPARWAGGERVLDVFYADPAQQLALRRRLRTVMPDIAEASGGPIILIFHTTGETRRLYPEIVAPGESAIRA